MLNSRRVRAMRDVIGLAVLALLVGLCAHYVPASEVTLTVWCAWYVMLSAAGLYMWRVPGPMVGPRFRILAASGVLVLGALYFAGATLIDHHYHPELPLLRVAGTVGGRNLWWVALGVPSVLFVCIAGAARSMVRSASGPDRH